MQAFPQEHSDEYAIVPAGMAAGDEGSSKLGRGDPSQAIGAHSTQDQYTMDQPPAGVDAPKAWEEKLYDFLWLPRPEPAIEPFLPMGMSSFLFSNYPKYFGTSASVPSQPTFIFAWAYLNNLTVTPNNARLASSQGSRYALLPNQFVSDEHYSIYNVNEFWQGFGRFELPLSEALSLIFESEYYNFNMPLQLNSEVGATHSVIHYDFYQRDLLGGTKANRAFVVINQQTGKPVYVLDPNKANGQLADFLAKLKWNFFKSDPFLASGLLGTNLLPDYLARTADCSFPCQGPPSRGIQSNYNYIAGLLFDFYPVNFISLNYSYSESNQTQSYLSAFPSKLSMHQFQVVASLKRFDFGFLYQRVTDPNSTTHDWVGETGFWLGYAVPGAKYTLALQEDDFLFNPSHLDFGFQFSVAKAF